MTLFTACSVPVAVPELLHPVLTCWLGKWVIWGHLPNRAIAASSGRPSRQPVCFRQIFIRNFCSHTINLKWKSNCYRKCQKSGLGSISTGIRDGDLLCIPTTPLSSFGRRFVEMWVHHAHMCSPASVHTFLQAPLETPDPFLRGLDRTTFTYIHSEYSDVPDENPKLCHGEGRLLVFLMNFRTSLN